MKEFFKLVLYSIETVFFVITGFMGYVSSSVDRCNPKGMLIIDDCKYSFLDNFIHNNPKAWAGIYAFIWLAILFSLLYFQDKCFFKKDKNENTA